MEGEIMLDFQKSTKITLSRYIQLMERQLGSKIAGPVQFREIPNQTQLFQGWIDTQTGNPTTSWYSNLNCTAKDWSQRQVNSVERSPYKELRDGGQMN